MVESRPLPVSRSLTGTKTSSEKVPKSATGTAYPVTALRIQRTGICTYIYHIHQPNVSKYPTHGSYGYYIIMTKMYMCEFLPHFCLKPQRLVSSEPWWSNMATWNPWCSAEVELPTVASSSCFFRSVMAFRAWPVRRGQATRLKKYWEKFMHTMHGHIWPFHSEVSLIVCRQEPDLEIGHWCHDSQGYHDEIHHI